MRGATTLLAAGFAFGSAAAFGATPDDFGAAATTCLEATQTAKVDEALIESRGWARRDESLAFIAGPASSFRRPGATVGIIVAEQDQQCLVIWVTPSVRGADQSSADVARAIRASLQESFGNAATATQAAAGGPTRRIEYAAGNSVGLLKADLRGSLVQIYFTAMNKNLADPSEPETD